MSLPLDPPAAERTPWPELDRTQCRILGVLVEKGLCTPEYYPLSLNALVTGCNQRNNRHPLTQLTEEEVEPELLRLKALGFVECVMPSTGRVERWRQELGRRLALNAVEIAVLGELLVRGPQSEGELRAHASRMRPIESLESLRLVLEGLARHQPPLVERLSPPLSQRGVRWTHCLGPQSERETFQVEEAEGARRAATSAALSPGRPGERDRHEERIAALEERVAELEQRLAERELRS